MGTSLTPLLPFTPCLRKFEFNDPTLITYTHTLTHTHTHTRIFTHLHTYGRTYTLYYTVRVWDVRPFAPADRQLKVFHGHKHGFEKVSVHHGACIINTIKKNQCVACPSSPLLCVPQSTVLVRCTIALYYCIHVLC